MRKGKCVKKIAVILFISVMMLGFKGVKIEAEEIYLKIKTDVYMKEKDTKVKIPTTKDIEEVPLGTMLLVEITITGTNSNAIIQLVNSKGYSYMDYYPGIMKIDKQEVSGTDYQKIYTEEGLPIALETTISIEVTYTGLENGVLLIQPVVTLTNGPNQGNSYTQGYEIKGIEREEQELYVQFFDPKGKLIKKQEVSYNESVEVPEYSIVGYTFLGFNTRKDGKGNYYNKDKIKQSMNYYAVIEPITYKVNYYVEKALFVSKTLTINTKVEAIEAPNIKGMKFIKWVGLIDNLTEDINVYALYQKEDKTYVLENEIIEEKEVVKRLEIINQREQRTDSIETKKTHVIEIDSDGSIRVVNEKQRSESKQESKQMNTLSKEMIVGGMLTVIFILIGLKKNLTKKKKETSNF